MKILLYDSCQLEENYSSKLKIWKISHITLYAIIAFLGLLNFVFLQNTKNHVNDRCVFYPRHLEFKSVPWNNTTPTIRKYIEYGNFKITKAKDDHKEENDYESEPSEVINKGDIETTTAAIDDVTKADEDGTSTEKILTNDAAKSSSDIEHSDVYQVTVDIDNVTVILANMSYHKVLDTVRTLFRRDEKCQFAEFMPLVSSIVALVWLVLFTMCLGGERHYTGIPQPWRVVPPALGAALVLAALTGAALASTDGGLRAFCAAFHQHTNTTQCSAVDLFLEHSSGMGFGWWASGTRGLSAGVWAGWVCCGALLLARCLAAPDFRLRRTAAHLSDPHQKIIPYLRKRPRRRSPARSPRRAAPGNSSHHSYSSEPTLSTQLVSNTADSQRQHTTTTTADVSPAPTSPPRNNGELIEMAEQPSLVGLRTS